MGSHNPAIHVYHTRTRIWIINFEKGQCTSSCSNITMQNSSLYNVKFRSFVLKSTISFYLTGEKKAITSTFEFTNTSNAERYMQWFLSFISVSAQNYRHVYEICFLSQVSQSCK